MNRDEKPSRDALLREISLLRQRVAMLEQAHVERTDMALAAREKEAWYRKLFHNSQIGIYRSTPEGRILIANQTLADILKYPSVEALLRRDLELEGFGPDYSRGEFKRRLERDGSVRALEAVWTTRYGATIHVRENAWLVRDEDDGTPMYYEGTIEDVTEQKRAERALRESERRFARFMVHLPGYATMKDADGHILFMNEAMAELVNPRGGAPGSVDEQIWPAEVAARLRADDEMVISEGRDIQRIETMPLDDGPHTWLSVKFPIYQGDRPALAASISIDITQRKQAEDALFGEKERLDVTLRSIGDAVITTDTDARVTLMNPVAESLLGCPQQDALGRPLAEVLHLMREQDPEARQDPADVVLHTGESLEMVAASVLRSRNGAERIVAYSAAPILDGDVRIIGVVLVLRDITERRRFEAELAKMEKLESIGILAGGIAHDFNNILTSLLGNINLVRLTMDNDTPASRRLSTAEKAVARARDLTQQLLTFSKGGAPVRTTSSLTDIVQDAAEFALRGSNVRCEYELPEELWPVHVDPGQIGRVISNLVINADQAMADGGTITLRGDNVNLSFADGIPVVEGGYVRLLVEDHGEGIPPDVIQRVFDPFFSTKEAGSGLGLATSYSIIKSHGGHIAVRSEIGLGTRFDLYLPVSDDAPQGPARSLDLPSLGGGHVLVMDDDAMIRDTLAQLLPRLGYQVDFAEDGEEAVRRYDRALADGEPFDAVIVDLTIPGGMGGADTIELLHKIDPQVRAIVSSGYSDDPVMAHYRDHGFAAMILKPYKAAELGRVLAAVLKD